MDARSFPDGIWLVDFEFHPTNCREGNVSVPVCMVTREWPSGQTRRYWQDALDKMTSAPFPTGDGALCVAYFASAEMDCFQALGWALPTHLLDLFPEFRWLTNGLCPAHGNSLLGALLYYGLPTIGGEIKEAMRALILTGGPWTSGEREAILEYCEADVVALGRLLPAMHLWYYW